MSYELPLSWFEEPDEYSIEFWEEQERIRKAREEDFFCLDYQIND